jgi:hypothetical protein
MQFDEGGEVPQDDTGGTPGGDNAGDEALAAGETGIGKGLGNIVKMLAAANKGGRVEAGYARGGRIDFRGGGHVPGRPPVPGPVDTETNDVVPAKLSPGEIVLPRSITKRPDAPQKARDFVAHLAARRMRGRK